MLKKRHVNRALAIVMVLVFGLNTFRVDALARSVTRDDEGKVEGLIKRPSARLGWSERGGAPPEPGPFMGITMDEWAARQNRLLVYGGVKSLFVDAPSGLAQGIAMMALTGADGTTVATFVLDLVSQIASGIGEALAQGKSPQMMAAGVIVGAIGGVLDLVSNMLKIFTYQPQPITEVENFRQTFIKEVKKSALFALENEQQRYIRVVDTLESRYNDMKNEVDQRTKELKNIITSQNSDPNWQKKLTNITKKLKQEVNNFAVEVKGRSQGDEGDGNNSEAWKQIENLSHSMTGGGNKGQSTLRVYAQVLAENLTPRDGNVTLEQAYNNLQDYFSSLCGYQLKALNYHAEYLNSDKFRPNGGTPTQAERKEALNKKFQDYQGLLYKQAESFKAAVQELGSAAQQKHPKTDQNLFMYFEEDAKNINSLAWCFLASVFAPMGDNSPYPVKVVYVSPEGGAKGKDGKSWETARAGLQMALGDVTEGKYTELWLKAGTYAASSADEHGYTAGEKSNDALRSFQMKNGCAIFGGFAGYELSCEQRDPVKNKTILDGQSKVYHVIMNHIPANLGGNDNNSLKLGSSAMLDGVIVKDGGFNRTGFPNAHEHGGGMFNGFGAAPYIANCVFENNYARDCGGAVVNLNASPFFTNCAFLNNEAGGNSTRWAAGGAVAQLKLNDTPKGTTLFEKCAFQNNHSLHSGGAVILADKMNIIFKECGFFENYAGGWGGAVFTQASSCYLEIDNSYFLSNYTTGNNGGAVHVTKGAIANIANCTFYDNHAERDGGGLSVECDSQETPCVIANCTFLKNYTRWANWGSSVRLWGNRYLTFKNNIVKGPDSLRSDEIPLWLSGSDIDARRNIYDTGHNIPNSNKQSNDPKIHDPAYNGGWWPTCSIDAGSPAQGYAIVSVSSGVNATIAYDARGRKRETPDSGAFEYATKTTFHVVPPPKNDDVAASKANMSRTQDGGRWSAACSLEQALLLAAPGDEVWAKQGRYYPQFSCERNGDQVQPSIISGSGGRSFVVKKNVSLYGGFIGEETDREKRVKDASSTVLDGNIDMTQYDKRKPLKDTNKFKLPDGSEVTVQANAGHVVTVNSNSVVDGFSVVNGQADRASMETDKGAGILVNGQDSVIQNSQIKYNIGDDLAAIHSVSGQNYQLNQSLVAENTSSGDNAVAYVKTTKNSTFCGNTGSGIHTAGSGDVIACTIAGNSGYGFKSSTANCAFSIVKNTKAASDANTVAFGQYCYGVKSGQDDPKLGDLAQNGGWTETKALLAGSPCLNGIPANVGCPSEDQRGVSRPNGEKCDVGAFESRGELYIIVETSDPNLGLVKENGGDPAPSFFKTVQDGKFTASDLNFTADPKDGRELIGWRYLNKVDDPKHPGTKIKQLGVTYSTKEKLTFDKPLVFGGYAENTAVLHAVFSVPHYKVSCSVIVPDNQDVNGVIHGDQPPTWRDVTNPSSEERVTGPIPKSTQDSPDKKSVTFNMFNENNLTLHFSGLGSAKLRYVTIDGAVKQVKNGSFTFNQVTKNYVVKAWFSESESDLLSVQLQASPTEWGSVNPDQTMIVSKGKVVDIQATPKSGYVFKNWSASGDATLSNPKCPKTSVHVLTTNTTVSAIFDRVPANRRSLTVFNGRGSGSYAPGQNVKIQGLSGNHNKRFNQWRVSGKLRNGRTLDWDENAIVTSFVMPDEDVVVEAIWEDFPLGQVTLNVINGTGYGNYNTGDVVSVSANDRGEYMTFKAWSLYDPLGELDITIDDLVADPQAAATNVVIPGASVTIEALYDIDSDLDVQKLRITTDTSKDDHDSVNIVNAELPDDFELSETVMDGLIIQIDDYELPLDTLDGEWKIKKNGTLFTFQTVRGESPPTRLRFDLAKNLWSLDLGPFSSLGEIGTGRGAVTLVGSVDDEIIFASKVTEVQERSSWSYALSHLDDALIANQPASEFGFADPSAFIRGQFKGVGGEGLMIVKLNKLALGLPDDIDPLETLRFSLDDLDVFLFLESAKRGKYRDAFVGDPEGWVRVDLQNDELSLNIDTSQVDLLNIDDGLDIAISWDGYQAECHILPSVKRILSR